MEINTAIKTSFKKSLESNVTMLYLCDSRQVGYLLREDELDLLRRQLKLRTAASRQLSNNAWSYVNLGFSGF